MAEIRALQNLDAVLGNVPAENPDECCAICMNRLGVGNPVLRHGDIPFCIPCVRRRGCNHANCAVCRQARQLFRHVIVPALTPEQEEELQEQYFVRFDTILRTRIIAEERTPIRQLINGVKKCDLLSILSLYIIIRWGIIGATVVINFLVDAPDAADAPDTTDDPDAAYIDHNTAMDKYLKEHEADINHNIDDRNDVIDRFINEHESNNGHYLNIIHDHIDHSADIGHDTYIDPAADIGHDTYIDPAADIGHDTYIDPAVDIGHDVDHVFISDIFHSWVDSAHDLFV
jgi:hypothetical protein